MSRTSGWTLFTAMLVAVAATELAAQDRAARDVLERAIAFAGGRQALGDLQGIRANFLRTAYSNGQGEWPGAAPQLASESDGTEALDFRRERSWRRYHLANSGTVFRCVVRHDSTGFMRDTIPSGACGGSGGFLSLVRWNPVWMLHVLARSSDATVRRLPNRDLQGVPATGVEVLSRGDTIRVWADPADGRPLAFERVVENPVNGASTVTMAVANWSAVGSLRLPLQSAGTIDGEPSWHQRVGQLELNPSTDSLYATVKLTAIPAPTPAPTIAELAPGVYRLEGATHSPLAVQLGDSIVVIDAPIGDAFMQAALDSLRSRFPRTPVRSFVVSHHHSDHVSGVRAAFAAGLQAVAPARISEFVRRLGTPSGQKPPAGRKVLAVEDSMAVGTGPARFVLYTVPSSHDRALLIAWFPELKLLWDADLIVSAPETRRELYDFVKARDLQPQRLSPGHGRVLTWESFLRGVPGIPRQ